MGLSVRNLGVTLGRRRALDGIDADLERGRVTAILGPNGAGKSTLLKAMLGLIDAGAVEYDGRPVAAIPPRERGRRLGYLPQSAELAWNIPAREVVALGRSAHRSPFAALSPADHQAIERAMAATDMLPLADRLTGEMSGGERARVMLARVLAGEPEWLFADEPLASLDPAHQVDILARLRAAADAGSGVVIVLHDLSHAASVADDVLLLREGRLIASGPGADVLTPERLRAAYGIDFDILDGGRAILPVRQPSSSPARGGGPAKPMEG